MFNSNDGYKASSAIGECNPISSSDQCSDVKISVPNEQLLCFGTLTNYHKCVSSDLEKAELSICKLLCPEGKIDQLPSCGASVCDNSTIKDSESENFGNENEIVSANKEVCNKTVLNEETHNVSGTQNEFKFTLLFNSLKNITCVSREFVANEQYSEVFLKGCKWSPDGTCLLTNSNDATMRLFDLPLELYNCYNLLHSNFPELKTSLKRKVGGVVYDYGWYPLMSSTNPETCCFVTTSSSSPVHLWDAFTGCLRCSYRGFDAQDELHAALSVTFHPSGELLLCGYKNSVNIFHTDVPGRDYTVISTKGLCEQVGLVSCIAINPSMPNIFAAGTYSRTVGLYSLDGHGICLLSGQGGGLTQLSFTQDGTRLVTAARKDPELLVWDLRNLGKVLAVMRRPHSTNQRIYMDLSPDDKYLLSGSSEGEVFVWEMDSVPDPSGLIQPLTNWKAHNDCVNGLSIHRHIPVVATASGQRFVVDLVDGPDDELVPAAAGTRCQENSVKLWWAGAVGQENADLPLRLKCAAGQIAFARVER